MVHRSSPILLLGVAALVAVGVSAPAHGQAKIETTEVNFPSADGVELQGVLYKSVKPGPQPCVILLHSPTVADNKGSATGDWHGLAQTLAGEGFNVLRFDFRGHGKSDLIKSKAEFWNNPKITVNARSFPVLFNKKPQPDAFKSTEYIKKNATSPYIPMLANDVMAARVMLDVKNDSGDLNTSSTYLIGAGDATIVGMLYLMAEWDRPQVQQPGVNIESLPLTQQDLFNLKGKPEWAGKDIAGAIWLSPTKPTLPQQTILQAWVKNKPQIRDANKMMFVYGADDLPAKDATNYYFNQALIADPPKNSGIKLDPIRLTKKVEIKKSKLSGVDLLGKDLGTETEIVKYLKDLETDRKNVARVTRNWTVSPYIDPVAYRAMHR